MRYATGENRNFDILTFVSIEADHGIDGFRGITNQRVVGLAVGIGRNLISSLFNSASYLVDQSYTPT